MRIYVTRNGRQDCACVEMRFATDLPIVESVIPFTFKAEQQYAAVLLERYLSEQLQRAIMTAHQNGYEQGWGDAKGKKRKKKIFYRSFGKSGELVGW